MPSEKLRFTFTFTFDTDSNDETLTVLADSKQEGYVEAREKAIRRGIASDKQDFESKFNLSRTAVEYADPPWDSSNELKQKLQNISGVSYIKYKDPYSGAYGPPTYYLGIKKGVSKTKVKKEVNDYFSLFQIEEEHGAIAVKIAPDKCF